MGLGRVREMGKGEGPKRKGGRGRGDFMLIIKET